MARVVRCLNSECGRATRLGRDPLGRVFRCPHCRTKLPTAAEEAAADAPAIRTIDLRVEASAVKASRSAAAAASLAACASAAWNHPVLISTWESSLLQDGRGDSGEVLIGAAEARGGNGFDRSRRAAARAFGDSSAAVAVAVAVDGFESEFDDDDALLSGVYVPSFSGAAGAASWYGSSQCHEIDDFGRDRDRDRGDDPNRTVCGDGDGGRAGSGSRSGLTRLARFRILGVLGEGAKAAVYRAHDPLLDREVALKVPRPGAVESAKGAARFLAEAKALARLKHPRIVPVFEAGRADGVSYIAMALVEGRTLADLLADGPLEPRRAAAIVQGLAEALAYAHGQGVVHRDVKPANVRIDGQGNVHLMDFGIAYLPDSGETPVPPGVILGTPAYVAPEQARGGQSDVLPASDQYSLGAVLYELLCGRPPFCGPPSYVLFHAIHEDPPPPRTVDPRIPRPLAAICLKALAKRPEDRYASCQALADDLSRWLNGETPAAPRRSPWPLSLRTG